jgi:hypothetical protein
VSEAPDRALRRADAGPREPEADLLDPIELLLHALQAGHQHVALGLELVEALVDGIEVGIEAGEPPVHLAS